MGWNGHDRPGAVFHQDKIGRKDGHFLPGQRIEAISPGKDPFLLQIGLETGASVQPRTFSTKALTGPSWGVFRQNFMTRGCSTARLIKVAP